MIVNINRKTGQVDDIGQFYNPETHENREVNDAEAAKIERRKKYELDRDGKIVEKKPPVQVQPIFLWLDAGQDYTDFHEHDHDQILVVLTGVLLVVDRSKQTEFVTGQSTVIKSNTEHKLTGAANGTLVMTAHRGN